MPIMKLPAPDGKTIWILHPHRIFYILDSKDKKSCDLFMSPHLNTSESKSYINIAGYSARQLKRSIQENVVEPMHFLKSVHPITHNNTTSEINVYFNVDHLVYITETEINKSPQPSVPGTALHFEGTKHTFKLEHDHKHVALQIRRIANKLDQDEELCCSNLPTEEE